MLSIILNGAKGRMGRVLAACASQQEGLKVAAEVDLGDDLATVIDRGDVVLDFSFANATATVAALCATRKKALVIGTTGHNESERAAISAQRSAIPIVWASNYSIGVNTLFWLTRRAAEILGPDFDLEVVEMHHRQKVDAPSGTAATLADILRAVRQQPPEALRHGRVGQVGARTEAEIGVHSLRGGDVVGDHTVIFAGPGERLELTHRAASRETFALGALRAALWVVRQPPGLYDMQDVLQLK